MPSCKTCSKKFYDKKHPSKKFCSKECAWESFRGKPSWAKGKKFSEQHRNRISIALKKYLKLNQRREWTAEEREKKRLKMIGNTYRRGKKLSEKQKNNISKKMSGNGNPRWNGGIRVDKSGYILQWCPEHPNARNNCVRKHRLVVEKEMGRLLKDNEVTHHINKNKKDNRAINLMVFASHSAHTRFHAGIPVKSHEIIFDGRKKKKGRRNVRKTEVTRNR